MQRHGTIHLFAGALACLATIGLAACTHPARQTASAESSAATSVEISGELAYRERMALPPHSKARVLLNDVSTPGQTKGIAKTTIDPEGQIPIPFTLVVPRAQIKADHHYQLHSAILDAHGASQWSLDKPLTFGPRVSRKDLGTLWLVRDLPGSDATSSKSYTARGNEPGWMLSIGASDMTLDWNYGANKLTFAKPQPSTLAHGRHYATSETDHTLEVTIHHALCHDSMTGLPYPDSVQVIVDATALRGCGGEPASLLEGAWTVATISGHAVLEDSLPTLDFGADGRVSGNTGCNSFSGSYKVGGEGLEFGALAMTLKACGPTISKQERAFVNVLNNVSGFDIDSQGALVLRTKAGETLTATPSS